MAGPAEWPPSAQRRAPPTPTLASFNSPGWLPLQAPQRALIYQKSRFFILGVAKRRLADWILIVALSTMVCSDPTNSNASSRNSNSKSEALWRPATGCHPRTPRAGVWQVAGLEQAGIFALNKAAPAARKDLP